MTKASLRNLALERAKRGIMQTIWGTCVDPDDRVSSVNWEQLIVAFNVGLHLSGCVTVVFNRTSSETFEVNVTTTTAKLKNDMIQLTIKGELKSLKHAGYKYPIDLVRQAKSPV